MKKIIILLIFVFSAYLNYQIVFADNYIPYNPPAPTLNISPETSSVTFKFPNSTINVEEIIYVNGRLFLPLDVTAKNMGANVLKTNNSIKYTYNNKDMWFAYTNTNIIVSKNDIYYISLYAVTVPFNLTPVFDINANSVTFYKRNTSTSPVIFSTGSLPAYIRFEDIMADGIDSADPDYTVESLEKLTYIADYMSANGQKFYISWIPVYVNPQTGCINDVTTNFNLYNSCFIYTLDYLVNHGGSIVLHGYTHQYGSDKSADGHEWGNKTPYSQAEQQNRMIKAKITAAKLGYNNDIFEFPHYSATADQLKMAEHYFKVIYQSYPSEKLKNIAVLTKGNYYIPTPADYVYNPYDVEGILNRLKTSIANNYAVSLFYHPVIDIKERTFLYTSTDEKTMTRNWYFSDNSALIRIIKFINSSGRKFTALSYGNL